jgi:hypothetical protein
MCRFAGVMVMVICACDMGAPPPEPPSPPAVPVSVPGPSDIRDAEAHVDDATPTAVKIPATVDVKGAAHGVVATGMSNTELIDCITRNVARLQFPPSHPGTLQTSLVFTSG